MVEILSKGKEKIHVIGFPKSGNTWLARLISEATDSNLDPVNPVDAADFSLDRKGNYVITKQHTVQNIDTVLSERVVYIVRDPRDAFISGFFHCNRWCTEEKIRQNFFVRWYFYWQIFRLNRKWQGTVWSEIKLKIRWCILSIIHCRLTSNRIGSWSSHVTYWSNIPSVITIRYEDLVNQTETELTKIFIHFGITTCPLSLREVIENQSFKNKKKKFLETADSKNSQFLRSGKAGGWQNLLPSFLVKRVELRHALMMKKFNYKLESKTRNKE